MSLASLILAAGKGSRMKSKHPKVLHEVGGASLLHHTLMTSEKLKADKKHHCDRAWERFCQSAS